MERDCRVDGGYGTRGRKPGTSSRKMIWKHLKSGLFTTWEGSRETRYAGNSLKRVEVPYYQLRWRALLTRRSRSTRSAGNQRVPRTGLPSTWMERRRGVKLARVESVPRPRIRYRSGLRIKEAHGLQTLAIPFGKKCPNSERAAELGAFWFLRTGP